MQVSNYGIVKSSPAPSNFEAVDKDTDVTNSLSLTINVRDTAHNVVSLLCLIGRLQIIIVLLYFFCQGCLVEIEVEIKNNGDVGALVEKDFSLERGHLLLYVTDPCGNIKVIYMFCKETSKPFVIK